MITVNQRERAELFIFTHLCRPKLLFLLLIPQDAGEWSQNCESIVIL